MPKRPPPKQKRWRVYLMRGRRAEWLGELPADTEAEALNAAFDEFNIRADWQKKRVLVRREE